MHTYCNQPSHHALYVALIVLGTVYSTARHKIAMQHFHVVYHGISHVSLVFSSYTHLAKSSCVQQENKGDLWGIQHYYAYHSKVLQNSYVTDVMSVQGHIFQNYRLLMITNRPFYSCRFSDLASEWQ